MTSNPNMYLLITGNQKPYKRVKCNG